MRTVLKLLAVVVVGTVLGLAATWFTVFRGTMAGGVSDGPWKTSLYAGSSEGGPYLRASIAVHGLLALNRQETIYYTASTDSDGAALSGACVYQLRGWAPPARWWSITAYGADDYLIPNAANRYSVSMNSVVLGEHSMVVVTVSKTPVAMNWIPVTDGRFNLSIRLYNPDDAVAADPEHVALFDIHKVRCA
jgi:hypothetical protein